MRNVQIKTKEQVLEKLDNLDLLTLIEIKDIYNFIKINYPDFYNSLENRKDYQSTLKLIYEFLIEEK